MKKKITHLRCPMNHTDLTKGKVYEVVEQISEALFAIKDDVGDRVIVSIDTYNSRLVKHREGWIPSEPTVQPSIIDRTIFRNEWTAMGSIVFVLGLLIWALSTL